MWTYRVVKVPVSYEVSGEARTCDRYGICELYDGGGYTDPMEVEAVVEEPGDEDPIRSLRWQLDHMLLALDKPIHEGEPVKRIPRAAGAAAAIREILATHAGTPDGDPVGPYGGLNFGHLREILGALDAAGPVEVPLTSEGKAA